MTYAFNLSVFITQFAVLISLHASNENDSSGGVDIQLILQIAEICNIVGILWVCLHMMTACHLNSGCWYMDFEMGEYKYGWRG
jgi:hypothetical protein